MIEKNQIIKNKYILSLKNILNEKEVEEIIKLLDIFENNNDKKLINKIIKSEKLLIKNIKEEIDKICFMLVK